MNNKQIIKTIIVIIMILLILYRAINTQKVKYKVFKKVFNKNEVKKITKCFDKNKIDLDCYKVKKTQKFMLDKIKKRLNVSYLKIHQARYSHGNKNFDAKAFHRDIKPSPFSNFMHKFPNVYTIICVFDDNHLHQQGNQKLTLNAGDCLLFNAFNLHKGVDMGNFDKNSKRRILQLFNVFFDPKEEKKFHKQHSYSQHYNNDFYLKYINGFFREAAEYLCLAQLFSKKYNKYITYHDPKKYIATIDDIKYYKKF